MSKIFVDLGCTWIWKTGGSSLKLSRSAVNKKKDDKVRKIPFIASISLLNTILYPLYIAKPYSITLSMMLDQWLNRVSHFHVCSFWKPFPSLRCLFIVTSQWFLSFVQYCCTKSTLLLVSLCCGKYDLQQNNYLLTISWRVLKDEHRLRAIT